MILRVLLMDLYIGKNIDYESPVILMNILCKLNNSNDNSDNILINF